MPLSALARQLAPRRTFEDDIEDLIALWGRRPAHVLSEREWEVAVLVTRGCCNREIAEHLVLSERTVDTHVSHILHKLGLGSRAQIAAWVVVSHQRRFKVAG